MNTSPSPDAFTIERHGDLTLIAASPSIESIDPELEEQVAEIILNCLRDQDSPLVVFDLTDVDYFGSMFLAVLLRCWKLTTSRGRDDGPRRGLAARAGAAPDHLARHDLADLPHPREAMEALLSD